MKSAGKVLVVSALVLLVGLAASNASAGSKSNSASSDGIVWGGGNGLVWSGGNSAQQPANRGQQHEQAAKTQGCFAGTASENAGCITRAAANKVIGLVEGLVWGGGNKP